MSQELLVLTMMAASMDGSSKIVPSSPLRNKLPDTPALCRMTLKRRPSTVYHTRAYVPALVGNVSQCLCCRRNSQTASSLPLPRISPTSGSLMGLGKGKILDGLMQIGWQRPRLRCHDALLQLFGGCSAYQNRRDGRIGN